ncbi:unnamed protein product [Rhizophagus irregularis]|nr:unnamed protein product [Rhizophagus irregularis]
MMINIDLSATAFYEGGPLVQIVKKYWNLDLLTIYVGAFLKGNIKCVTIQKGFAKSNRVKSLKSTSTKMCGSYIAEIREIYARYPDRYGTLYGIIMTLSWSVGLQIHKIVDWIKDFNVHNFDTLFIVMMK